MIALLLVLSACTDRSVSPTVPAALSVGTNKTVFAVTTRAVDEDGYFGYERSDGVGLLELTVSIPPTHEPGTLKFGYGNPDPERRFTMADRRVFADRESFIARLRTALRAHPPANREVTVFVHGYNATQAETAFRAAQLVHDMEVPGETVIYSWPSRGQAFGYVYDYDSAIFARDGLERLLRSVRSAGASRVVIIAHSMGSALTMEALRQIELSDPGWSARSLGGIMLISPDLDVDVFRSQVERIETLPQPFILFVSSQDRALNLSARLRGQPDRLGSSTSVDEISDLPVTVVDGSNISSTASSSHFIPATSPAMIAIMGNTAPLRRTFDNDRRTVFNDLPATVREVDSAVSVVLEPPGE